MDHQAPPDGHAELVARLRTRQDEVLEEMSRALADTALCAVRPDRAHHVKYLEGVSAALAQVRRTLETRARSDTLQDGPVAVVAQIRQQWGATEGIASNRGHAWSRYLAGALDALDELAASLTAGDTL
ncbi:hypothetical protein [Actinotalea sp. K2]|uniref:hypothetical protein n=1 Tax=Actinotalea sp. K2 TaxID=2939438 RepID=UPI002016EF50|nr:hypothetical protein [Actinotalea sp. K2]MCL3862281.1 hypothetical protein [Actinotalea sp. K2]